MAIYIIIYIVFTLIFAGMLVQYAKEKLSKHEWFIIVTFGWIASPIIILISFGKFITYLNENYG